MAIDLSKLKSLQDFENALNLRYDIKCYFSATAGRNGEYKVNERAFQRTKIIPRILRNVSSIDLTTSLLGTKVKCPINIAPTGCHFLLHPTAELGTAQAAFEEEVIMAISCVASLPLPDIANHSKNGMKWFQIYIFQDRSLVRDLVMKAESCGCLALLVTLDSPTRGLWSKAVPDSFSNAQIKTPNLPLDGYKIADLMDSSLTFEDIDWLKSITKLPIVAKGVMTGNDAAELVKHGVSAILVSNHGARQIDGVSSTVDVLEDVISAVRKVNPEVEVYLDGGVRSGSDVFRALALGARAIFIGRPVIWGLNVAGADGVKKVLRILKEELIATMKLAGTPCLKDITRDMVRKEVCCAECIF